MVEVLIAELPYVTLLLRVARARSTGFRRAAQSGGRNLPEPRYASFMRTTLQLDDGLITEAKVVAARTGRTLSQVIEDALRQTLVPRPREPRTAVVLPTSPGSPRADVVLEDNAALRDLMDALD